MFIDLEYVVVPESRYIEVVREVNGGCCQFPVLSDKSLSFIGFTLRLGNCWSTTFQCV